MYIELDQMQHYTTDNYTNHNFFSVGGIRGQMQHLQSTTAQLFQRH